MTNGNDSNGTDNKGGVKGLLGEAHAAFIAAGGKAPDKKVTKALVEAWQATKKARKAAETAFEKAQKAESDAVMALVKAHGKGKMRIDGTVLIPMSRGETMYFREEGGGDVRELG